MCCVTNRDVINGVLTNVGSHFAIESLQYVNAMVGELFVQPITMDHEGKKALIFPFAVSGVCLYEKCLSPIVFSTCLRLQNLAIKMEGNFVLRYRVFDLFSQSNGQEGHAAMACCYGSQFRVYSTKDFPGLRASTGLTKVREALFLHHLHRTISFLCSHLGSP